MGRFARLAGEYINTILDFLGKKTKINLHYAAWGSLWLTIGQGVAAISGFAITLAFANWFPKDSYGAYKYLLSMAGMLSAASLTGLNTAIIQSVARGQNGLAHVAARKNLKWSIGFITLALGISAYYFLNQNYPLGWGMAIIAFTNPLLTSWLLYRSYLAGKGRFRQLAETGAITTVIPAILIILTIRFSSSTIAVIAAYYLANGLVAASVHYAIMRHGPNHPPEPASENFSLHLSIINALDVIATYIDKVIAFQIMGAGALATYSLATAIPEQARTLLKNVGTMAIPKFSQHSRTKISANISRKIILMAIITLPLIIGYIVAAPWLFKIFFPQYLDAIPYSRLFAIILIFEGGLAGAALKATMAIKEQYILNSATNVLKIALLVGGTIWLGIWGIIVARILTRAISFFLSWSLIKKSSS